MAHRSAFLLVLLLVVGAVAPVFAEDAPPTTPANPAEEKAPPKAPKPFLWVIEGEPKIYLFGTIHVPDERVTTLPDVVKDALSESDVFWGEIESTAETQQKTQARTMLPAGKGLSTLLEKDVYERAGAFLAGKGYSIKMFEPFKVWALAVTLPILDILPQLAMTKPLDGQLYADMEKEGKEVGALETVEEQLGIFDAMTTEQQTKLLVSSLDQMEKSAKEDKPLMESLIELYLEGDAQKLHDLMYAEYDPTDELSAMLMKKLLDDRNVRMVDRLLERAAKAPDKTYFVAVGAAHFPGKMGILKLLEKKGKKVERVKAKKPVKKG